MKKMFVTGMNMNEAKAYVEPKMQVIEVDVQSLLADSEDSKTDGEDISGGEGDEDFVKLYKSIWF